MIGRWARALVAVLLAALSALAFAQPVGAQYFVDEHISDYHVDLTIQPSGDLLVKETIQYDFGSSYRHGIFRDVPVRFGYNQQFERVMPLHVESVETSPDGTPDDVKVEDLTGGIKRIKIGDPDKTITGAHTYVITYTVKGALNGFPTHDELYWNAIGQYWEVPIDRASARVTAPGPILHTTCFAGPDRSATPCTQHASVRKSVATFTQDGLDPFEALTVVVGFPKGLVPEPKPILDERWSLSRAFETKPWEVGLAAGLLLLIVVGFVLLMLHSARDKRAVGEGADVAFPAKGAEEVPVGVFESKDSPIEFAPPENLRPGQIGTLIDEVANPLDVTATIVDFAVRGYLRIDELPKEGIFGKADWKLTLLKPDQDDLLSYERTLLSGLFQGGSEVELSELKNTFAERMLKVQESLYADATKRKWFAGRPDKVRQKWRVIGSLALAAGAGIFVAAIVWTHLALVAAPFAIGGLLLLIGSSRMPRRTAKGTGLLRRTRGFREFIEDSEKVRARFAEDHGIFTEYLPYAIVFGATKKWAKAFEGLENELPANTFYYGGQPFMVSRFCDSMEGFSVVTAGTLVSTPAGSGGSGFGGGGGSGGGGGGGGGGSW